MSAVADSGPLISLAAAEHLDLLRFFFSRILIESKRKNRVDRIKRILDRLIDSGF